MAREAVEKMLKRLGHRVILATDGIDALKILANQSEPVEILLTDLVMPGMGGVELAKRLKEEHQELKIILMSGYMDELSTEANQALPSIPMLRKPFPLSELAGSLGDTVS